MRIAAVLLVGACATSEDPASIQVAEANDLGVTGIQTARSTTKAGDSVFELHALAADGSEVGSVRLRVGWIKDLPFDRGSDISVIVHGQEVHTAVASVDGLALSPATIKQHDHLTFLRVPEIAAALREASVSVLLPPVAAPAPDRAFWASWCPSDSILPTLVHQCCYTNYSGYISTTFVNQSNQVIDRAFNPYGTPCKASDGVSWCGGSSCYYGPNGYSKIQYDYPGSGPYWTIFDYDDGWDVQCAAMSSSSPGEYYFDQSGSLAAGQLCPEGNDGGAVWDY